jgi:hypothetical protein
MPDRYDEELERLRSMDVPDQWDDISRRATAGPVQPSEPGGRRARWPILAATAAILVLVAGSTTVLLRDDQDVTETEPTGNTAQEPDHPTERSAPPASVSLPPGAITSCTLLLAPAAGSGLVPVPGPADPPLVPDEPMAGVDTPFHIDHGSQTVEIHVPATRAGDLASERTETVETSWGEATVWYAAYGNRDTVQIRLPSRLGSGCDWDVTVHGPDEAANRTLAIDIASGGP